MKNLIASTTLIIGVAFGGFAPSVALAESQTYKFDPSHTEVIFSYQHLGMSRAFGQFKKITGNVKMDKAAPAKSSVDVAIDVATDAAGTGDVISCGRHKATDGAFQMADEPRRGDRWRSRVAFVICALCSGSTAWN